MRYRRVLCLILGLPNYNSYSKTNDEERGREMGPGGLNGRRENSATLYARKSELNSTLNFISIIKLNLASFNAN